MQQFIMKVNYDSQSTVTAVSAPGQRHRYDFRSTNDLARYSYIPKANQGHLTALGSGLKTCDVNCVGGYARNSNLQGLWAEEPHSGGAPRRYGKVWSVQNAIAARG
jgi:hypothetical protein